MEWNVGDFIKHRFLLRRLSRKRTPHLKLLLLLLMLSPKRTQHLRLAHYTTTIPYAFESCAHPSRPTPPQAAKKARKSVTEKIASPKMSENSTSPKKSPKKVYPPPALLALVAICSVYSRNQPCSMERNNPAGRHILWPSEHTSSPSNAGEKKHGR